MRLRIGIALWVLSWVPYGVILGLKHPWLEVTWAVEITMGVVGLALAGTAFAGLIKACGWRRAPVVAWRAFLGREQDAADVAAAAVSGSGVQIDD